MIYNWDIIDREVLHAELYKFKFYISSKSQNGAIFFERYNNLLDITVLERDNQVCDGKEFFEMELPENSSGRLTVQKRSFESLYNELMTKTLNRKESKVSIRDKWGEVKEPVEDIVSIWSEFDKNFNTVHIVSKDGQYIHSVTKNEIISKKLDLKNLNFERIFVEYDTENTMQSLAGAYLKTSVTDIPVLKNGRIDSVASCRVNAEINFRWKYINQEVLDSFFAGFPRIALSSLSGKLKDFYELYKNTANINILSENLVKHIDDYDAIITGCEGSEEIASNVISISQLYLDLLSETVKRKFEAKNISYFYFQRPFDKQIHNLNHRWADHDGRLTVPGSVYKNGYYQAKDYSSEECHIIDGQRLTVAAPLEFSNTIWCFGPCIIAGINVNDEETLESQLQAIVNSKFNNIRVVNWGQHGMGSGRRSDINSFHKMLDAVYQEGDIVVHFGENTWSGLCIQRNEQRHELADVLNTKPDLKCFVAGVAPHLNKEGYDLVAHYVFDTIQEKLKGIAGEKGENERFRIFDINELSEKMEGEVNTYIAGIKKQIPQNCENKTIGSIVMNCNPFTYGHAYLIEESLKKVDILYVFVVEEDKSFFPFSERIEMVRQFCKRYDNVYVFPSGKCIGSSITFGEYFNKNALQDAIINPALDVMLFGKHIASALNISIRFVGEEPTDNVTRQYNVALREKLPTYHVKLDIIPRRQIDGRIVSASSVRMLMKQNNIEKIKKMVPDSSMPYILSKIDNTTSH